MECTAGDNMLKYFSLPPWIVIWETKADFNLFFKGGDKNSKGAEHKNRALYCAMPM